MRFENVKLIISAHCNVLDKKHHNFKSSVQILTPVNQQLFGSFNKN